MKTNSGRPRSGRGLGLLPLCLGAALLVGGPAVARAGKFENLLKRARKVTNLERVVGPFVQICGRSGSVEHMQCRAIRSRMQRSVKRGVFWYTSPAAEVGKYNGQGLNYPVQVLGCLTCKTPFNLRWGLYAGKNKWYVTTTPPKKVAVKAGKTSFTGLELTDHLGRKTKFLTIPVGPSETEMWERSTKRNLRVQFIFAMHGTRWPGALRRNGVVVEMKGYRLYNQCNGKVLASVPASSGQAPVAVNPTCKGRRAPVVVARATRKVTPQTLQASIIRRVMRSANEAVKECYDTYQIQGLARVRVKVVSDGTVKTVKVIGKFKNTPTGKCIKEKILNLIFPRFLNPDINFTYPFYLR